MLRSLKIFTFEGYFFEKFTKTRRNCKYFPKSGYLVINFYYQYKIW